MASKAYKIGFCGSRLFPLRSLPQSLETHIMTFLPFADVHQLLQCSKGVKQAGKAALSKVTTVDLRLRRSHCYLPLVLSSCRHLRSVELPGSKAASATLVQQNQSSLRSVRVCDELLP